MTGAPRSGTGRLARAAATLRAAGLLLSVAIALPATAAAEQASQPGSPAAAQLEASGGGDSSGHTCAVLVDANVRCWGFGGEGRLGYANTRAIGDNETPAAAGPVSLGAERTVKAISAGAFHTCALLSDDTVRCWGFGGEGRLGYADTRTIGDDEAPVSVAPVDLGPGRTAKAISAGGGHTCAVLDDDTVRCWGFGSDGRLGYANRNNVGDDETPGSAGPVDLGAGRKAKAISAGQNHTCALLDDDTVRCWGIGTNGQLGYGDIPDHNPNPIGDDETPGSIGPVNLGTGRTTTAISAGSGHTCALLGGGAVRCWGFGGNGRLGYSNTDTIGDDEAPGAAGPVDLGPGLRATAISAGDSHTCARLEDGALRCWGYGADGRLGYANTNDVGDNETPASVGAVSLGSGMAALAVTGGGRHTCARLADASVRCWGYGANGRLGLCSERTVGDNEAPAAVGPVALGVPGMGARCSAAPGPGGGGGPPASGLGSTIDPLEAQAARARGLRGCQVRATRHARLERRRAGRASGQPRARLERHVERHRKLLRRACLKRWGRTPGRVSGLRARAISKQRIVLTFDAPGTDGSRPPAARTYLIKQSRRPIRGARGFRRATTLCEGSCRLSATRVGEQLMLRVRDLRPRTTYHYALAARDNVSRRLGPRSSAVKARTR